MPYFLAFKKFCTLSPKICINFSTIFYIVFLWQLIKNSSSKIHVDCNCYVNNFRTRTHIFQLFVFVKYRPCFNRNNFRANWHVFLDVNWAIHNVIPNGRVVCSVDDINLYFNRSRKRRKSFVLCYCFQSVGLALSFLFINPIIFSTRPNAFPPKFKIMKPEPILMPKLKMLNMCNF